MKTKLIASLLLVVAAASSAEAQSCKSSPAPVLRQVVISKAPTYYQDLLDRCSSYISDLVATQRQANMVARTGNLKRASQIMAEALYVKASILPPVFSSDVLPHTVEAIRNGNALVQAVRSATGNTGANKVLSGQVELVALNKVYDLINSAYHDLDARFFLNNTYACRYACDWNLPSVYYDGIRSLAQRFLDLRQDLSRISAYDSVELKMTAVAVGAAKNILVNSIFRRQYSCEVTALHGIEAEINQFTCGGGEIPSHWFIADIRGRLNSIQLNRYTCY